MKDEGICAERPSTDDIELMDFRLFVDLSVDVAPDEPPKPSLEPAGPFSPPVGIFVAFRFNNECEVCNRLYFVFSGFCTVCSRPAAVAVTLATASGLARSLWAVAPSIQKVLIGPLPLT